MNAFEIESKLEKEKNEISLFKDRVEKYHELTSSMSTILNSFENRLGKLETTILPVYNVTKSLQQKQHNLEQTIAGLDTVLSHYGASQDTCNLIHLGPNECGIAAFLEALDKLKKAKDYFLNYNDQSVELQNVTSLYNTGCETLNNYFKTVVKKHSSPMRPVDLLDFIYIEEDSSNEDCPSMKQFAPTAREELGIITAWLDNNLRREYVQIYGDERSDVVSKSLQLLKDHQKSGSWGNEQLGRAKYRDVTPSKKTTSARLQSIFERKANKMLQKASQFGQTALRKNSVYGDTLVPEEYANDTDQDLEKYLVLLLGLQKLLLWERQLMKDIIPATRAGEVFSRLAQNSIEMVVRDAENITTKVLRNIARKEWSAALGIFSALKHVTLLTPDIEKTYDQTQRQQLLNVLGKLQQTGAKALEQFIETVKGDSGSNLMTTSTVGTGVPKDATVHELTSNAIWFVEHLQDHVDSIGSILINETSYIHILETLTSHKHFTQEQKNKILLGIYVRKVLTELNYTIVAKSDLYSDPATKQIFKLNNVHYILKSLQQSNLLDLISITETDTESRYNKMIQELKQAYHASWGRLLGALSLDDMPRPVNGKCKEKERQIVKDRFSTFNKELEEAVKIQRKITIPDVILREGIKRDNLENIIPAYNAFFELFHDLQFSKNVDKYVKYRTTDVTEKLNTLFDDTY
ncbi:exocyst complex component 7 [Culicoides brevitarsis]|uniref:exocyst complex component 7 n=1 Tax=Culicoides brevitarsis TaxID=469753 RepID=UPI00307CC4FE